jgi:hypothetical protein
MYSTASPMPAESDQMLLGELKSSQLLWLLLLRA